MEEGDPRIPHSGPAMNRAAAEAVGRVPAADGPPSVTVVIPTLNEAANLPHVLPRLPKWVAEVIIVDGASTDGTPELARQLMPAAIVLTEERPGKGLALRRGFDEATSDIIVMMDADGSTAPDEIGVFVRLLRDGADFVKGSRFLQGAGTSDMDQLRRCGNYGLTVLTRLLFGGRYTDLCYGFSAFWRHLLPTLELDADGFEIETLMNVRALKANLIIVEVPSYEEDRIYGDSNLDTFKDGWRVLRTILRERFLRPAHAGSWMRTYHTPLFRNKDEGIPADKN